MSGQYALKHSKGVNTIRRRRFTLGAILLVGVLLFFFVPWEIPLSFGTTLSRANVARLTKSKKGKVGEIYGLLHLVTGDHEQEHVLSNAVQLDPTLPIDLSFYGGQTALDWSVERDYIDTKYPVIVFSKTYCRFSQRAKDLIATYNLEPPPHIVEVDMRDDGNVIKTLLTRLTGQSTFPNILLQGKSIGGSDRLQELHDQKLLKKMFQEAGANPN
ncbi:Glutaredoxin-C1 [Psilocybe cubensis]|uniref:Glutaredoxin domain-containing protein n=2 Tax=Psilocybe cubensis TaxID=181762 RepID=A0A8H7Y5F5_PSICU|nr:Glutaredoxin-C1 [Psilocybe cubensis]KAH9485536.1 Glutaredoxin-C1 [Psilocybe cubensis]